MHREETPKLPFHENFFWLFIRHVWFRQGLTGIGCMMLSCKNKLPPPPPLWKGMTRMGCMVKSFKNQISPPSALSQQMSYSWFMAPREISRWPIKIKCFCRWSIFVFKGKNKQTKKQTNQTNQTSLNRLRLLMTASIVKGITFAVVNRSVHANATISRL